MSVYLQFYLFNYKHLIHKVKVAGIRWLQAALEDVVAFFGRLDEAFKFQMTVIASAVDHIYFEATKSAHVLQTIYFIFDVSYD